MELCGARQTALQILGERVEPDPDALLRCIAPLVDDAVLREISECDYELDADLNFWRLQKIRNLEPIPAPLDWNPGEVLRLTRWQEPGRSKGTPRQIHIKRAFACAALIRAGDDHETWQGECAEVETLTQLVESVVWLGSEATIAALRSLGASAIMRQVLDDQYWFALGLLMLAVISEDTRRDSALHEALLGWYLAERNELSELERDERAWIDRHRRTMCGMKWLDLASRCLIEPFRGEPASHAPDATSLSDVQPSFRSVAERLIALGNEITRARWNE